MCCKAAQEILLLLSQSIRNTTSNYFTCPYCHVICPREYLTKVGWKSHIIHDLKPYHCTYERCPDPNRLYGSHQEWLNHEATHTRVWHCHAHACEFETQPEYVQHLHQHHGNGSPNTNTDQFAPELIAAAIGPSLQPHRDCPLCPSGFASVTEMQKHIKVHLERLALFCLPPLDDRDTDSIDRSSDSSQVVQGRGGRQDSLEQDFEAFEALDWDVGERPDVPEDILTSEKLNIDAIRRLTQGEPLVDLRFSITDWLQRSGNTPHPETQYDYTQPNLLRPDSKPKSIARKPRSHSSSTSSSLLTLHGSRPRALERDSTAWGSFFRRPSTPSRKGGQRLQGEKERGDLSVGDLSSSSIDSDLAYGTGYIEDSPNRTFIPQDGDSSHRHRGYGEVHADERHHKASAAKRNMHDEEIIALGLQLSEMARREQQKGEHGRARRGTTILADAVGSSTMATKYRLDKQDQSSGGDLGSSKPHRSGSEDDSAWESASDDGSYPSADGADSDLAYGETVSPVAKSSADMPSHQSTRPSTGSASAHRNHTHGDSVVGPSPRPSGLLGWLRGQIKSTAVTPTLSSSDHPEIGMPPGIEWGPPEMEGSPRLEGSPGI